MRHELVLSAAALGWFESWLISILEAAPQEHPNASLRCLPLHRSHLNSQLLSDTPEFKEKVHANVNETLRREPVVPDFERGLAAALFAGRNRRVGLGGRGPRDGPLQRLRVRRDGDRGGGPGGHHA